MENSSIGKTSGFGPEAEGSNPSSPAPMEAPSTRPKCDCGRLMGNELSYYRHIPGCPYRYTDIPKAKHNNGDFLTILFICLILGTVVLVVVGIIYTVFTILYNMV